MSAIKSMIKSMGRFSYRFHMSYVHSRMELPYILNALGLRGEGAEVGVRLGHFSEWILDHWQGKRIHAIDPWREFGQEEYVDVSNRAQQTQDEYYRKTCERLGRFGDRAKVMRCTSEEAAPQFADGQLDFVYIDAQHHYEAVKEDIALWVPKIRKGGVIAGHDYLDGQLDSGLYGVKRAVGEFVKEHGVRKLLVSRETDYPSWIALL